jgi:hypothetical protein
MTKILCLSGKKGSGKTTLASFLERNMAEIFVRSIRTVRRFSFAAPIKEMCVNLLGVDRQAVYGSDADKNRLTALRWQDLPHYPRLTLPAGKLPSDPLTSRELQQQIGTMLRILEPDCWVRGCLHAIAASRVDLALIDDCRFPNEVQAVQQAGGVVVRLTRGLSGDRHESETALDGLAGASIDHVLDNRFLSLGQTQQALVDYLIRLGWAQDHAYVPDDYCAAAEPAGLEWPGG